MSSQPINSVYIETKDEFSPFSKSKLLCERRHIFHCWPWKLSYLSYVIRAGIRCCCCRYISPKNCYLHLLSMLTEIQTLLISWDNIQVPTHYLLRDSSIFKVSRYRRLFWFLYKSMTKSIYHQIQKKKVCNERTLSDFFFEYVVLIQFVT